jgi:precorrin-2 dehydrogenase/sirohydrochlorin ferrochelatase
VVAGGGKVAQRKALDLLDAGARVKVISPTLTKRLQQEKTSGRIKHTKRRFRAADLRGAYLVIVATDSPEDNEKIADACGAKKGAGLQKGTGPLLNVADVPEHCNFIVPATVKRGPLTIAVSTSGASPAMARAIRKELEGLYGPAFGKYLKELQKRRARTLGAVKDPGERERFFKSLASDRILKMLRKGQSPFSEKRKP